MAHHQPNDRSYERLRDELRELAAAGASFESLQHCVHRDTARFLGDVPLAEWAALEEGEREGVCNSLIMLRWDVRQRKVQTETDLSKELDKIESHVHSCAARNIPYLHGPRANRDNMLSLRQQHNYGQTHARTGRAYA